MTKLITKQEAFETALKGLYEQGMPATAANGDCQYRGQSGLKCGVGFLVSDSVYDEQYENKCASVIFEGSTEFSESFTPDVIGRFLDDLQRDLHDNFTQHNQGDISYREWLLEAANAFALCYKLIVPEIKLDKV